jgi:hypothetical protein
VRQQYSTDENHVDGQHILVANKSIGEDRPKPKIKVEELGIPPILLSEQPVSKLISEQISDLLVEKDISTNDN